MAAAQKSVQYVLFDLDGTLSDSAPGILSSLRHAFDVVGIPRLDAATEHALLGPPFYESLPPLIGQERVAPVIEAYRSFYGATGMFDTVAYDGVPALVRDLAARGVTLAVATSKPEYYAVPIVEHLGLAVHFATICGDDLDGSLRTKALVINKALDRLGRPDPATVLMVGDRSHDVLGARAHAIGCAGAGWGYGLPGELIEAGAVPICVTAAELAEHLAKAVS